MELVRAIDEIIRRLYQNYNAKFLMDEQKTKKFYFHFNVTDIGLRPKF